MGLEATVVWYEYSVTLVLLITLLIMIVWTTANG